MKQIKSSAYENLTPQQRVIAAMEACARDDGDELRRLRDTCPKLIYKMTDAKYSDTMQSLSILAITVENDLRGLAIGFLLSCDEENCDRFAFLSSILSIRDAWHEILNGRGIGLN